MDYFLLEKSALFRGFSAADLRTALEKTPHCIQCYDKEEVIFGQLEPANRLGIVLEGRVQAQKAFPNGSQINVTIRTPGEMLGPAAVFSDSRRYPCDVIALEPTTIMMFHRKDFLLLMQKNLRILENFVTELSSATYMLQQRLELFSYNGIAQKAAFWLLMQHRKTGKTAISIPESVTKWAMLMNVSRPSLHRELKKMESSGLIRYSAHSIELLDPEGLQELLSR
jgi:CRP-like cAMP-binding protein